MRLEAMHGGGEGHDAFVRIHHLEHRRLSDDRGFRQGQIVAEAADRVDDAEAGRLLVIGEHDVDRRLEIGGLEFRDQGQRQRIERLHVHRAAPIGAPVLDAKREGVGRPGLARHRHHVRMSREHDPAAILRADGGIERRLVAGLVRHAHIRHVPALQIALDEVDQGQVRLRAHGVERDKLRQHFERREPLTVERHENLSAARVSCGECRGRRRESRRRRFRRRRSP